MLELFRLSLQVIHAGCGAITTGDIDQAITAQDCTILAFNVGFANPDIQDMARRSKVSHCYA